MTTNNLVVLLLILHLISQVYGDSDCPVDPPGEMRHCIPSVDDPHLGLVFPHPDDPTCLCESCRAYQIMVQPCICTEDGTVIEETKCDHPPEGFFMPCHLNWCTRGFPCKTCMGDLIELTECTFNEDTVCSCPMHTDQAGESTCQPWPKCPENHGIHRDMLLDVETSVYSEVHICKACEDSFVQPKNNSFDRCLKEEEDGVMPTMETITPENEAALLMQCIPTDHDPHHGLRFPHPKDPNCWCDSCRQHMYMIEPCKCDDGIMIKETQCGFAPEGFYMPYSLNWCSSPLPCTICTGDLIELKECTFDSTTQCGCPMHSDLIGATTCQSWPQCSENHGIHREFDESMNLVHICKPCEKGFIQPYDNSFGRCIKNQMSVTTAAPDHGLNPHIIFATPSKLILYNLVTRSRQSWLAYEYDSHYKYLDVHIDRGIMYWTGWLDTEVITRVQIQVSNSDTSESIFSLKEDSFEVLSDLEVDYIGGIAIDWIHDNLYWTDAGLNTISVSNLDGSKHSVIIEKDLNKPKEIVVDPRYGLMFWINWGIDPRIEKAGLDGSYRSAIITADLIRPNGLAIDYNSNRLFWVDASMHTLSSCDFNGMSRQTIINSNSILPNPFSIAVFEDNVYWTDWNTGSIVKANKFDGSSRSVLLTDLTHPMSLQVIHPLMQAKNTENYCRHHNGGCSYLCVAAPQYSQWDSQRSAGYSCLCPDGSEIMEDGHTCTGQTPNLDGLTTVDPNNTSNHHHGKGWIAVIVLLVIILFILGIIMLILYRKGMLNLNR